jgi:hypothetical protein
MTLDGEPDSAPAPSEISPSLTVQDLMRMAMEGKAAAGARYDQIIWKIRAGYIAVVYGGITLLSALTGHGKALHARWLLPVIVGAFSLAAFTIDLTFSRSKYRLVASRNDLIDHAWHLAKAGFAADELAQRDDRLRTLLRISGEEQDPETKRVVWKFILRELTLVLASLYFVPPVIAAVAAVALGS